MSEDRATNQELSARLTRMEALQIGHLRRCMFLLLYFTVAFACLAWEWLKHFSLSLEALPIATVVLIGLWVFYVAKHSRDLTKLRLGLAAPDANLPHSESIEVAEQAPPALQ